MDRKPFPSSSLLRDRTSTNHSRLLNWTDQSQTKLGHPMCPRWCIPVAHPENLEALSTHHRQDCTDKRHCCSLMWTHPRRGNPWNSAKTQNCDWRQIHQAMERPRSSFVPTQTRKIGSTRQRSNTGSISNRSYRKVKLILTDSWCQATFNNGLCKIHIELPFFVPLNPPPCIEFYWFT